MKFALTIRQLGLLTVTLAIVTLNTANGARKLSGKEHNARALASQELDAAVARYAHEMLEKNKQEVRLLNTRIVIHSPTAKALVAQMAAKSAEQKKRTMEAEEDFVTSEEVANCMNRKAADRKRKHPNENPDPENYRWACYGERLAEKMIDEFGKWFEEKVTHEAVKWSKESEKKVKKWVADRKVERDANNTWDNLIKRGRIGGEVGKAAEGVKKVFKRLGL